MRHSDSRLRDLTLAVALAVAVPMLAAGPAVAGSGYGQLIVNPGKVAPGQTISILGTCPVNGVQLTGVYSSAFVGGSASISKTQINFSGSATISQSASGSYTVSAACGPGSPSVTITVSGTRTVTESSAPTTPTTAPASPSTGSSHTYAAPATTIGGLGIESGSRGPTPSAAASPPAATAPASSAAASSAPASSAAAAVTADNGPVTSTGVIRVGLASSTQSTMTSMQVPAVLAAAACALGALGFLRFRRRRASARNTHN